MIYGKIKVWHESAGWGFIEDEDGYDYFFNIANLRKGQKVIANAKVKFDPTEGSRGAEAENVSLC